MKHKLTCIINCDEAKHSCGSPFNYLHPHIVIARNQVVLWNRYFDPIVTAFNAILSVLTVECNIVNKIFTY